MPDRRIATAESRALRLASVDHPVGAEVRPGPPSPCAAQPATRSYAPSSGFSLCRRRQAASINCAAGVSWAKPIHQPAGQLVPHWHFDYARVAGGRSPSRPAAHFERRSMLRTAAMASSRRPGGLPSEGCLAPLRGVRLARLAGGQTLPAHIPAGRRRRLSPPHLVAAFAAKHPILFMAFLAVHFAPIAHR